jgi:glutathione synthase/RimK-type ligase-like ATP-grasp enzyme
MIISNCLDKSTNIVIDWLAYYKKKYFVLNTNRPIKVIKLSIDHFIIEVENQLINSDEISALWYRNDSIIIKNKITASDSIFLDFVSEFEKEASQSVILAIYKILKSKVKICSFLGQHVDKINLLDLAQKCNIDVPDFIITTNIKYAIEYFGNSKKLITKTISRNFNYLIPEKSLKSFTEVININNLQSNEFSPSLIQEYIDKEYEIRSFFLKGQFYSMAVFSQEDDVTKVDMRKGIPLPNRTVPFKLPKILEEKLMNMFEILEIDNVSIDILKGKDGKFYF